MNKKSSHKKILALTLFNRANKLDPKGTFDFCNGILDFFKYIPELNHTTSMPKVDIASIPTLRERWMEEEFPNTARLILQRLGDRREGLKIIYCLLPNGSAKMVGHEGSNQRGKRSTIFYDKNGHSPGCSFDRMAPLHPFTCRSQPLWSKMKVAFEGLLGIVEPSGGLEDSPNEEQTEHSPILIQAEPTASDQAVDDEFKYRISKARSQIDSLENPRNTFDREYKIMYNKVLKKQSKAHKKANQIVFDESTNKA